MIHVIITVCQAKDTSSRWPPITTAAKQRLSYLSPSASARAAATESTSRLQSGMGGKKACNVAAVTASTATLPPTVLFLYHAGFHQPRFVRNLPTTAPDGSAKNIGERAAAGNCMKNQAMTTIKYTVMPTSFSEPKRNGLMPIAFVTFHVISMELAPINQTAAR